MARGSLSHRGDGLPSGGRIEALPQIDRMRLARLWNYLVALGERVTSTSCERPPVMATGLDVKVTAAGLRPSRVAVTLMVPGVSVERMATRLMPSSVLR